MSYEDLYPDQQAASDSCMDWIENKHDQVAGLWASAGFGKSHLCKHLIETLTNNNYRVGVTSLTHAACEVLTKLAECEVNTLHSTMGWIPAYDKKTGKEYLKTPSLDRCPLSDSGFNILLVDEAGLIGHEELALLLDRCKMLNVSILFVGDNKQCYPVMKDGQELCIPAYLATDIYLELTTPKRVDESDMLYKLCTAYRATVGGARQPKLRTVLNKDGSGKGVYVVDDIEEAAFEAFREAIKNGSDIRKVKVLTYTNKRSLKINRKIRKEVFGIADNRPYVGEEVQANTTISDSLDKEILIRNNQLLTVLGVVDGFEYGVKGWWLELKDVLSGCDVQEQVFVACNWSSLEATLKKLSWDAEKFKKEGKAQQAQEKWFRFFQMKTFFADVRNTYAITINKCQGSTLDHALIDMNNIDICRDEEQAARMAYTAVSRAKFKVTIEGQLSTSDWRLR